MATPDNLPMPNRGSLSIRAQFVVILVLVSALAAFTNAWLGYSSGREILTERIASQLTSVREIIASELTAHLETREAHVLTLGEDRMVMDALRGFVRSVEQTEVDGLSNEVETLLRGWYESAFLPSLALGEGAEPVLDAFLPDSPVARLLQFHYVTEEVISTATPLDQSPYPEAHQRFHRPLSHIVTEFGYHDLFLIGPNGRVVFSVSKEADFGTSMVDGPFRDSGLGRAFRAAREARARRVAYVEDMTFYTPSGGAPAMFFAAPVFDRGEFLGVVALQSSTRQINEIVHNGGRWRDAGLGDSGEVFVVGSDRKLRSTVRPYLEDADAYLEIARGRGLNSGVIERIRTLDSPTLLQRAESAAVLRAIDGERVIMPIARDYQGRPALSAAAPLDLPGLDWVVVAEMPDEEAFAPVRAFGRSVLVTTALLSIALTVIAMLLARLFTRPLARLTQRAQAVIAGELDVDIQLPRSDEFGELSHAMQQMLSSLREQTEKANVDRLRSEALLGRFLPDGVVRMIRVRDASDDPDMKVSEEVANVSLVIGRLTGYEGLIQGLAAEAAVAALDDLVQLVDAAAERHGVEKVRTVGDLYVAAAGLSTPHLDSDQRAIAFAIDMRGAIRRYARERDLPLAIQVALAGGTILSGVIGRDKLAYDIFGPPVQEVYSLEAVAKPDEIRVAETFAARLDTTYEFIRPEGESGLGLLLEVDAPGESEAAA